MGIFVGIETTNIPIVDKKQQIFPSCDRPNLSCDLSNFFGNQNLKCITKKSPPQILLPTTVATLKMNIHFQIDIFFSC